MLVIDTRIKLLLFILINFMVFGLKDFILGSVCFFFICILSCLMGQKKIVLKYLVFYVVIAAIQQLCIYLPQAIETILSIFTLFIRVMIPVVLFASTFIATTKVSELIAAMYSLKIPRSITITFAMVLRFFPTFSEEIKSKATPANRWDFLPMDISRTRTIPSIGSLMKKLHKLSGAFLI